MKKLLALALTLTILAASFTACGQAKKEPVVEEFSAQYEMIGTTSSGAPKNDTFIFEGKTEDGIITELNFDIIRNKGTDKEYSKTDIMGYLMNISDAEVAQTEEGFSLVKFTACGYDTAYGEGNSAQFMVTATTEKLTEETAFKDLTFTVDMDKALIAFSYVAKEAGIENFNEDTLVKDLIAQHGLYKEGEGFATGSNRISFAGFNGGRSYGEQIRAIRDYILEQKMTLEQVYEMFKTVNQPGTQVQDRDVIAGATITFVGDFQRMAYMALHGEVFEGVVSHTTSESNTVVEVITQGYAGEIETLVTFDANGAVIAVSVRDANETESIGAELTKQDSEFTKTLVSSYEQLDKVEVVAGATVTSNALIKAVQIAMDYYKTI